MGGLGEYVWQIGVIGDVEGGFEWWGRDSDFEVDARIGEGAV